MASGPEKMMISLKRSVETDGDKASKKQRTKECPKFPTWKKIKPALLEMPQEIMDRIFQFVWPYQIFWVIEEPDTMMYRKDLFPLQANSVLRSAALPVFGARTTLTARIGLLDLVPRALSPAILGHIQYVRLHTQAAADWQPKESSTFFDTIRDNLTGPGELTDLMPRLKWYSLDIHFGHRHMHNLDLAHLTRLRGGMEAVYPYTTSITIEKYADPGEVWALKKFSQSEADFYRRWTFAFPANKRTILVERELQTKDPSPSSMPEGCQMGPPTVPMRCNGCFRPVNGRKAREAMARKPDGRTCACPDCEMAIWCSGICREKDIFHEFHECVFHRRNLINPEDESMRGLDVENSTLRTIWHLEAWTEPLQIPADGRRQT